MRILIALCVVILAECSSASFADEAKPDYRYIYEEFCEEKNPNSSDRFRICGELIRQGNINYKDSVVFIHTRIKDLLTSIKINIDYSSNVFNFSTFIAIAFSIIWAFLLFFKAEFFQRVANVFKALVILIPAVMLSFGWREQLRAELWAYENLWALRDRIEIALISDARGYGQINDAMISSWITRFDSIIETHSNTYSASHTVFSTASLFSSSAAGSTMIGSAVSAVGEDNKPNSNLGTEQEVPTQNK